MRNEGILILMKCEDHCWRTKGNSRKREKERKVEKDKETFRQNKTVCL